MTPLTFAQYVRFHTSTNSTTFTDSQLLMLANVFKDDIATEIIKANEDYFGTPEVTNLVASQREYPMPSDMLNQVKHVEAQLDAVNWITLNEFDLAGYPRSTDEATITSYFSNQQDRAFFDIFRGSLWIYSGTITNVTNGLKIWTFQWPADFTDLTLTTDMSIDPTNVSAGFPRAFHELLARRVSIEWKTASDKGLQLTEHEQKYDGDLASKLDSISEMNQGRETLGALPNKNKTWNNGFNL